VRSHQVCTHLFDYRDQIGATTPASFQSRLTGCGSVETAAIGCFNVLGISVVAGRRFTRQEDANALAAVIVSEAAAGTEITCGRVGDSR
jgi:hypothetical protein